jgi:sugar/nucleoside kinase (ribokinase family)
MTRVKIPKNHELTCVGTGLVALDVILNGSPSTPAKLCAGGSCGNVMSILAFLGWNSKPIARFSNNNAAKSLFADFENFKVDTSLISLSPDGVTPIIIHRILKDKFGNAKHKFEFRIPATNIWLPSYKPVLASAVDDLVSKQPNTKVFYFDRVSRSSINLAQFYKKEGALIFFEPSSFIDNKQFKECLEIADIIKYSNDRISNYTELFPTPVVELEIETLGKEGLKYRRKSSNSHVWKSIASFGIQNIVDSAGAGDWCTSAIINELGTAGSKSFYNLKDSQIEEALGIGQAFGAINCMYDGARGVMYNMNYDSFVKSVEALLNSSEFPEIETSPIKVTAIENFEFNSIL